MNKNLAMIITVTIAVICVGSILVPVINDAQHSGADSFDNGSMYMAKVTKNTEMIITNTNAIYSDGNEITGYGYAAILADSAFIAINNGNVNIFWGNQDIAGWSAIAGANITINPTEKTITLSEITHSSYNDNITGDTLVINYGNTCFYRAVSGDYVSVEYANIADVRVLEDSDIFAATQAVSTYYFWNNTEVTVNGVVQSTPGTITLGSSASQFKTISAIAFGTTAPSFVIIPEKIWGDSAINNNATTILKAIPAIVIIGLLILTVSVIKGRDNE